MTKLLYWIVYHIDLGPLGPKILDLAVRTWFKQAKEQAVAPLARRRVSGWLTSLHLQPSYGADERM